MFKRLLFSFVFLAYLLLCSTAASAQGVTLHQGIKGREVTKLQSDMKRLGYFKINPTGYYGTVTREAVKKLQRQNGLVTDGVAGSNTLSLINRLLNQALVKDANQSYVASTNRGEVNRNFVVVIDAGHGGTEPGAIYGNVSEKDLNLSIAKKLKELLASSKIKTYMTRTDDTFVSLTQRSKLANNLNADLFISVHNNADGSGTRGTMSLYYPSDSHSKGKLSAYDFAAIVQKELTGTLKSRHLGMIARPNLSVLRRTTMPAVIAEVGYLSNPGELSKLTSEAYQQKAAEALKNAVLEALRNI